MAKGSAKKSGAKKPQRTDKAISKSKSDTKQKAKKVSFKPSRIIYNLIFYQMEQSQKPTLGYWNIRGMGA